jgi:hypothetical protein
MLLTGWPSRVNDAEGRLIPLAPQDRRKTASPRFFLAYGWTAAMDLRLWRLQTATVERCFTPAGTGIVRDMTAFPLKCAIKARNPRTVTSAVPPSRDRFDELQASMPGWMLVESVSTFREPTRLPQTPSEGYVDTICFHRHTRDRTGD